MKNSNVQQEVNETKWLKSLDFLWLEITPKCNLNCVHCYAESTPFNPLESKMKYNDWCDVLTEAYNIGCRQMQFIGGEPTIHPDLIRMIKVTKKIGYEFIEVYTNGISINETMFETFVENNVHLAFSVYSFKNHTHDLITNRQGSFEKTIKSIKKAIALGLDVRVGIITMEENFEDEKETIEFINSLGVKNVSADRIRGIGRGKKVETDVDPMTQLCGACWKGQLVVDADGKVFPCVFSRFNVIGSIIEEGFNQILENDKLHSFRKEVKKIDDIKFNLNCDPTVGTEFLPCNPESSPCHPECSPECSPNCSPNCNPNCSPYCSPECNPYSGCKPK